MRTHLLRRAVALIGATGAIVGGLTATATSAHAAQRTSAGPLRLIEVTNDLNCRVDHVADASSEFFNGTACATLVTVGNTLFGPASIPAGNNAAPRTAFTTTGQNAWVGAGTSTNPYRITTTVVAGTTGVSLREVDTYVVGSERYRTDVTITAGANAARGILYRAGDCFLGSNDQGYGAVNTTASLYPSIACTQTTSPTSRHIEWIPINGATHYMEAGYGAVWARIGSRLPFPDTCACASLLDNGAGLSWDWLLEPFASVTFSHWTDFGGDRPLVTRKTVSEETVEPGCPVAYTITISNPNGRPMTLSTIFDTLPGGFSYVPGSTTGVTTADPSIAGQTLTWTGPWTIPARSSVTLTFRARTPTELGDYVNTAGGTSPDITVTPYTGATVRLRWPTETTAFPVNVVDTPSTNETVRFRARLVEHDTRVPLGGRTLSFHLGTRLLCSGTTDAAGYASCYGTLTPTDLTNARSYRASFAGTPTHGASFDDAPITRNDVISTEDPVGTLLG